MRRAIILNQPGSDIFESERSLAHLPRKGPDIPLKLSRDRGVSVDVFVDVLMRDGVKGQFEVDTGLGDSAIIDSRFMAQLGIDKSSSNVQKVESKSLTGGMETSYKCSPTRLALLKASELFVTKPDVTFKDNIIYDGLLGGSFWLGKRLTIDIPRKQIDKNFSQNTEMHELQYPSLYQINTRVLLTEISRFLSRPATLDDIPDAELDRVAAMGFDWVWLMSVWQTGLAGQQFSRSNRELRREFEATLPDLREEDIAGSGFAITDYVVHRDLGGDAAMARLRERLGKRGLRLMLDFVANHTALDNPWVEDHPEYYITATEADLARAPQNYTLVKRRQGDLVLAHGRDPCFPGWSDTLQLNYGNPALQEAMIVELLKIAGQCDGVRCDMAMLMLPEVFERTWGIHALPFWPAATRSVREVFPEFTFMAEVYWDLEWTIQQQGFDYTYDKRLYDRLRDGQARPVREHLQAGLDYQNKLVRFLENHDEARAAAAFSPEGHRAAAVVTFLSPGMRFFHQGQFEGRTRRLSPHLRRAPLEPVDQDLQRFYAQLLGVLRRPVVRDGDWQLLACTSAWEGNWTWDCFVAFAWQGGGDERLLVMVNYAANQSQCWVRLPFEDLRSQEWQLVDLIGSYACVRDGGDLQVRGLYLDMPPWKASVFSMTRRH